jgi:hypothetical protein
VLAGIVVLAAGVRRAIVTYNQPADAATAWFLAGGVALYMAGLVLLRVVLRTGPLGPRTAVAAVALATVIVGLQFTSEWQITVLTLLTAAGIVVETRSAVRPSDDLG